VGRLQTTLAGFFARVPAVVEFVTVKAPKNHKDQQVWAETVTYSIESTYFHLISTDFHKRCDLFWDRWSHLHNLHELSGLQRGLAGDSVGFVALQVSSLRLCAGIL
jgi:hypothetical protein